MWGLRRYRNNIVEYYGIMILGAGAPILEIVLERRTQYPLTLIEASCLALGLLFLPLVPLAFRCAAGRHGRIVDGLLYLALTFIMVRTAQRDLMDTASFNRKMLFLLVGMGLLLTVALSPKIREQIRSFVRLTALLIVPLIAYFFWQIVHQPAFLINGLPGKGPPVIIAVMDELSIYDLLDERGEVDATNFPHFAALADDSIWFRNTSSNYAYTVYSFASFLSGRQQLPAAPPAPIKTALPIRLSDSGYLLNVASPAFSCDLKQACRARASEAFTFRNIFALLRNYLGYMIPSAFQPALFPSIMLNTIDELARHPQSLFTTVADGNFYLLHTMITHSPPLFRADGTLQARSWKIAPMPFAPNEVWNDKTRAALRERTKYADAWLGNMIETLKKRSLWQKAIFVLVADHGSCNMRGCWRIEENLIQRPPARLAFVPFFLHAPGITPHVDDRPAQLLDLAPTLWGVIPGLGSPPAFDGLNLLKDAPPANRDRRMLFPRHQPRDSFRVPVARPADGNIQYELSAWPDNGREQGGN